MLLFDGSLVLRSDIGDGVGMGRMAYILGSWRYLRLCGRSVILYHLNRTAAQVSHPKQVCIIK